MKRRIRKRERKREKMTVFQKRQIMNYSQQSADLCLFITFFLNIYAETIKFVRE